MFQLFQRKSFLVIVILSLSLIGCSSAPPPSDQTPVPTPPVQQSPTPQTISPADAAAISIAVQSAVRAFLSNDFANAQKTMLFQSVEQKDPKTARMFTEFSSHLNKRLALEAKGAGQAVPTPAISVANIRPVANSDSFVDVSIFAAPGLESFQLTLKATQITEVWLLDYSYFMMALLDALDE